MSERANESSCVCVCVCVCVLRKIGKIIIVYFQAVLSFSLGKEKVRTIF